MSQNIRDIGLTNKKCLTLWPFLDVVLVGGNGPQEGYVYAMNPVTKNFGPVCDDNFDIKDVSKSGKLSSQDLKIDFKTCLFLG